VRVIGVDNEQLGVMSIQEARKLADEAGLDLVKIAPMQNRRFVVSLIMASSSMSSSAKRRKLVRSRKTLRLRRFVFLPTSIQTT